MNGVVSLLRQGADINAICPREQYTSLIAAVRNADYTMVELLLTASNRFRIFNLMHSCNGEWEFNDDCGDDSNECFISPSCDIDLEIAGPDGYRALHFAAQMGNILVLTLLQLHLLPQHNY
jgi:ankyrin repeat protein